MDTLVIAFGYKAESGKDESVKSIIKARSDKFDVRRYGFCDAVKREVNAAAEEVMLKYKLEPFQAMERLCERACRKFDPFAHMNITDPLCPYGKQRDLLQWWGTEYRRAEDRDYWVRKLEATILAEKPKIALISDLRFLNEFAWVIDPMGCNGKVVRVDRLGYVSKNLNASQQTHQSETELSFIPDKDWHYIIQVPDGDLPELQRDAVTVFDHVIESLKPPDLDEVEAELDALIRANMSTPQGTVVINGD